LPFIQEQYRVIIDSLCEGIADRSDHNDHELSNNSFTCNTSLPYVSNDSYKFNINDSKLVYNVNFNKIKFFDSTVVSYGNYHYMGDPSSISFAGACNPNATASIIAQGLYATSFSNFIGYNHNIGYISVNLRVGDNIGLVCNIISCCNHLGQIISYSGSDWTPRMCTEAATSTFLDFHAPISRDICDFGIDCSVGDVLTYLFHVLNFQELVPRHLFCNNINNIIEYANKEFVTIELQCFNVLTL
jgi:hypothetical protein